VHHRTRTFTAAVASVLTLTLAAACGGDDDDTADPTTTEAGDAAITTSAPDAFPVTVTGTNGAEVEIAAAPERIVSLSPTATEDLFAIGAGEQVIAADDQSNYPPEAPTTDLSGFSPNVEAIGGYDPDLVVMSDESVANELAAIDVPLLVLDAPADLDGAYEQIETLGTATGFRNEAAAVVAGMQADVDEIVGSVEPSDPPLTYYYELDENLFSATSDTFIGSVLAELGLESIADAADTEEAGGYPQLSAEYIISEDPDFVFLADTKCCGQSAETVAARTGWSSLQSVADDHVVELDDDIASRWGPRVVDLMRTVAEEVQTVNAP
jgi:iron complex transport system substrate-binding protein